MAQISPISGFDTSGSATLPNGRNGLSGSPRRLKVLALHPGPLMYTKIYLRLEPLGLELVCETLRRAGHHVRLVDLQADTPAHYFRMVEEWAPDVVAISCNYVANVPEVVDLAKGTKTLKPDCFVFVGGHSASFVAEDMLTHAGGAIDCILKGEGETSVVELVETAAEDRSGIVEVPGAVTPDGEGPKPTFLESLDDIMPARDLLRNRRKYFIGQLDPAASIEFSRGCPWDCSFCSAWTFYGRSYRMVSPERAVEDLKRVREPGVFIVDDVAFIQSKHGLAIGEAIAKAGIKKKYYLETRGDVLLRNKEVFQFWRDLGIEYMFLGIEAIDEEGLQSFRKRADLSTNFEALEFARSLGIQVAINIIADPEWDRERFRVIREFCMEVPEIVNVSVNTPYPGTESWLTEGGRVNTRDYRLFDIQHAVMPTKLPLEEFYAELIATQKVLAMKHLGPRALWKYASSTAGLLLKGQTNFFKMLFKFNEIYRPDLLVADHHKDVKYEMTPPARVDNRSGKTLYIHEGRGRRSRAIDDATEQFVEATRAG